MTPASHVRTVLKPQHGLKLVIIMLARRLKAEATIKSFGAAGPLPIARVEFAKTAGFQIAHDEGDRLLAKAPALKRTGNKRQR